MAEKLTFCVDLSGSNQRDWIKKSQRRFWQYGIAILFAFGGFLGIGFAIYATEQQLNEQQMQFRQSQQQLSQINQQIEEIKGRLQNKTTKPALAPEYIDFLLDYLRQFKQTGSLEIIQLEKEENKAQIKMIGKSQNPAQFTQIEQHLKQANIHYQLDDLQTTPENSLEFQIRLFLDKE